MDTKIKLPKKQEDGIYGLMSDFSSQETEKKFSFK